MPKWRATCSQQHLWNWQVWVDPKVSWGEGLFPNYPSFDLLWPSGWETLKQLTSVHYPRSLRIFLARCRPWTDFWIIQQSLACSREEKVSVQIRFSTKHVGIWHPVEAVVLQEDDILEVQLHVRFSQFKARAQFGYFLVVLWIHITQLSY